MTNETHESNGTPETAFSWMKVWTTPFGMFVIFIIFVVGLLTYVVVNDREEAAARRVGFCQTENDEAKKVRRLWEGILVQSGANTNLGYVVIDGRRYDVRRGPLSPQQLRDVRELVNDTYPLRDCSKPQFTPRPTDG